MEPNLTYVYPHTRIQSLVSILRTTVHHAFPVVTENRGNEKEFMKGNQLISNNIKFKVRKQPRGEVGDGWLRGAHTDCCASHPTGGVALRRNQHPIMCNSECELC